MTIECNIVYQRINCYNFVCIYFKNFIFILSV